MVGDAETRLLVGCSRNGEDGEELEAKKSYREALTGLFMVIISHPLLSY